MQRSPTPTLLTDSDPDPVTVLRPDSRAAFLVVSEHAGVHVPQALADAYSDKLLAMHYGCDIGAGALASALGERLSARTVLGNYSRLIIDPNRRPDDTTLFLTLADDEAVAANVGLSEASRRARYDALYVPVHTQIEQQVQALSAFCRPIYIAIHSFTPNYNGQLRPWDMGVLWDQRPGLAHHLRDGMREYGLSVGDNEPYSGKQPEDFSIDFHVERHDFDGVAIEVRQDHLQHSGGVDLWADRLAAVLCSWDSAQSGLSASIDRDESRYAVNAMQFERMVSEWMAQPNDQ
ncbi:MAG: N-formylglutamate amidohydrolase [Pseudomonadota bacterium]